MGGQLMRFKDYEYTLFTYLHTSIYLDKSSSLT